MGLMAANAAHWAPNPIMTEQPVRGVKHWHPVSLVQKTQSELCAIEPINFATPKKHPAIERAGFLSLVFGDIVAASNGKKVSAVAVYRATPEDLANQMVKYSLSLIADSATAMVDWLKPAERSAFLEQRSIAAAAE